MYDWPIDPFWCQGLVNASGLKCFILSGFGLRLMIKLEVVKPTSKVYVSARSLMVVLLLLLQIGFLQSAVAIGVGATDVKSALGENLRILIPVFSVENPDSFVVSAATSMYGGDPERVLSAALDRSNSQLTVVISSNWPMVEPYVQFDLSLQDGNVVHQKEIIVLLEYKPDVSITDPLRAREVSPVVQISRAPRNSTTNTNRPVVSQPVVSGSIMGPYDVAEAGQIPEKFGAVLNGQSLWRVARRINEAMGVSVEQMMVALHEANPEAFSTDSVDSLKAGSYLTIPSAEFVTRLSKEDAVQRLEAPRNSVDSGIVVEEPSTSSAAVIDEEPTAIDAEELKAEPIEQRDSFVIGDDDVLLDGALASLADEAPRYSATEDSLDETNVDLTMVKALSKTVGELMRDNIDREQRIQSLEARLASVETTLDNVGLPTSEAAFSAGVQRPESAPAIESNLAATVNQPSSGAYRWILPLGFGLLLATGLFLRSGMGKKTRAANIFSTLETDAADKIVAAKSASLDSSGSEFKEKKSQTDYSALESNKSLRSRRDVDDEEIEGVSYHEFDDDLMVDDQDDSIEPTSITTEDTPSVTLEVPNKSFLFEAGNVKVFPRENDQSHQRKSEIIKDLDELIAEERYEEVRDLLDIFRGKQLDEANYHFQRLRLLLEEKDEHGFYEYFNLVENKFQDVDGDLKMDLANLVSRLNQN